MNALRRRFGRWHPAVVVVTAIGVALVALALVFDWNWFRPRLEQYLAEKSHRSVRIGDLHVSLSAALDPTLRLRRVRIDNAAWADARPLIDAGELQATFLLSSLIDRRPVISRLVLIDADVDLERQADGLRNWRLIHPEDRGPTRVRLMSIEAIRSKIRFAHRGLELDVQTAASPAENPQPPFTTRVAFEGTYREAPFAGEVETGPELTFLETGRSFPLRGHAVSSGARLEVDGEATDLFALAGIDANVTLRSPSLAPLTPLLGKVPAAPPLEFGGRL
ncbi:MAG: AsmA family protein, partial [Caldimonas sp.]